MKIISITTKYGPITLEDDDNTPKEKMAENLSMLMKATNITILKTSNSAAVIRPSLVSGIIVYEDTEIPTSKNTPKVETPNEPKELEQNVEDPPNEEIDIIKDME